MVRYTLRLFGIPILSLETVHFELVEDESDTAVIGGGSAHNFERDANPLNPNERYDWEWEDKRKFGF